MMNVQDIVQKRYSTKSFDASKKISAEDFAQIEAALHYSPSSVNIQPWHFVITDNEAGKARVAKSAENFPYNLPKIINASHVIVFAARVHTDDDYLAGVLEQEDKDGRFATVENKQMSDNARRTFLGIHRNQMQDETQWLSRQVHINLGFTLFAAAALGVDAVPLEGVDMAVLDQEFGLAEKGYRAVAVVALGYRAEDDFNAKLPKSRLENEVIFTQV